MPIPCEIVPGRVAVLAINTDRNATRTLEVALPSKQYTLTAPELEASRVELNGKELRLGAGDTIPDIKGLRTGGGPVTLPPASITFLALARANNASCR